jgi:hypothetical protein
MGESVPLVLLQTLQGSKDRRVSPIEHGSNGKSVIDGIS